MGEVIMGEEEICGVESDGEPVDSILNWFSETAFPRPV